MLATLNSFAALALLAAVATPPKHLHHGRVAPAHAAPACATDARYQALAFWTGDWEVLDSAGGHYAYERVRPEAESCAISAEWTGRAGDRGFNLSAFDGATGEWRQMYVSNQVPGPLGVQLRRSDPTYTGKGVRFVSLFEPDAASLKRSRITIMPWAHGHVMQLFEESKDGGRSWQVLFKAEHRPRSDQ